MGSKRYWLCIIGPVEADKLPSGSDFPMRASVRETFERLTGREDEHCWSGWGLREEQLSKVFEAWNSRSLPRGLREVASGSHESLGGQIERLANFIMAECPGEPSQNEGAVDCAIRIIKEFQARTGNGKEARCGGRIGFRPTILRLSRLVLRVGQRALPKRLVE